MASEKILKPDNVKCALFLLIAQERTIEIYNALTFTEAEGKYNDFIHKFKEFVEGKKDFAHEGETFLSFLTNITSQAGKCGFDHPPKGQHDT